MDFLIKKDISWNKFELIIDTKIFSKDIILKTAYNFLDIWYFIFSYEGKNIKMQCQTKNSENISSEQLILNFCDEILNVYLREKIENENKELRNIIISTALKGSIDSDNFVEIPTSDDTENDIEKLLKDLENDPELMIDEKEIQKLINQIKIEETNKNQWIILDINNINNVKDKFKNR